MAVTKDQRYARLYWPDLFPDLREQPFAVSTTIGALQDTLIPKVVQTNLPKKTPKKANLLRSLPCIHLGEPTGAESPCISCGQKGKVALVYECGIKGTATRTGRTKDATWCMTCDSYIAGGGVIVPQPPLLNLTPTSDRAIVTVAVGKIGEELLRVTRPYMEEYAKRLGADLVVLDWVGVPEWPMSAKFGIPRTLDYYDRIVYVDADVLLRPGCVDLFSQCDPDEFGWCDELAWHRSMPQYQREKEHLAFRQSMGFRDVPHLPWMCNAGVMVLSKQHREYLLPPLRQIQPGHCAEQDHTNAIVLDAFLQGRLKVRLLDRRCNWQDWTDRGFESAPEDAILHWSGAGHGRVSRAEQIQTTAQKYPLHKTPDVSFEIPKRLWENPRHEWYMDDRHVRWIFHTLASGRFKRVLEIGCYHGWSTSALLFALQQGLIQELHLCDLEITEELRRVILFYGVDDRVTIHAEPSVQLLSRDPRWDVVVVDGDHRQNAVATESRILLSQRTPLIFAHDTAAHPRYSNCEGPQILKRLCQTSEYRCIEDATERSYEQTDRGMFAAAATSEIADIVRRGYKQTVPQQKSSYIIASTPRSGSSLLAEGLLDCGVGNPEEWFKDASIETVEGCFQMMRTNGVRGRWIGLKLHGEHLSRLRLAEPLLEMTETPVVIALTRKDKLRQACSLSRAMQTGAYSSRQVESITPEFRREEIASCLFSIEQQELAWEEFYRRFGISPLRVTYEELSEDYNGTMRRVLNYLGETPLKIPRPRLEKQADALTERWVSLYQTQRLNEAG